MQSAVCFRDIKNAAIYFDRVIPLAIAGYAREVCLYHSLETPENVPERALLNLLFGTEKPPGSATYKTDSKRLLDLTNNYFWLLQDLQGGQGLNLLKVPAMVEAAYRSDVNYRGRGIRRVLLELFEQQGSAGPALSLSAQEVASSTGIEDPTIAMTGMGIIDSSVASWDQLLDLRRDRDAMLKLRRFRAFLTRTYSGKSRAFVEDELSAALQDYEVASKKHGFELVTGTLSVALDASSLQAAAAVGLVAVLMGGPLAALPAAAAVELGKMAIHFAKQRRRMDDWHLTHPLAYVIEARARLSKSEA